MNRMVKPAIVAGAIITAGVIGATFPAPNPVVQFNQTEAPEQRCMNISVANNWHAGDLCDTLPPAINVTVRQWEKYNKVNGWMWIGENPKYPDSGHCWKTTTTDEPYVLCYDGTLMKVG